MGKKVICYIQAYNCEKTVEAAMDSVLKQTYQNWLCFVLSNGNQNTAQFPNATFDVIRNFAARDPRFVVVNKRNNVLGMISPVVGFVGNHFPNTYFCTLDGDDEYESDFFARAVALAEAHDLDIVACGTKVIQKHRPGDREGVLIRQRKIDEDLIIPEEKFTGSFPVYKTFMNEMWGKLYRTEIAAKMADTPVVKKGERMPFVPDTLFVIGCIDKSRAIGILSGTSHRYYLYEQRPASNATAECNVNAVIRDLRKKSYKGSYSPYDTYRRIMSFLRTHGEVSAEVYEYMQAVLVGWLWDIYNKSLLPMQDEECFVAIASQLVFDPKFDELMAYQGGERYNNLRDRQQRINFCYQLRYAVLGQELVRNRTFLWRKNLPCSSATRKKLRRVVRKLDETIQMLSGESGG